MDNYKDDNKLGRRHFFGFVWIVALAALFAQAGYGLFRFMTPILEEGAFGSVVKAGRVLFEMEGVNESMAREAMRLAAHKLPIKVKFVTRLP